jgi:zinc protease
MRIRITHFISLVSISILLAGSSAASLVQNAPVGLTRYNRAPVSNALLRVHLPRAVQRTLENGVKVLVLEDHRAAQIKIAMYIHGAGGLFAPTGQPGLASMTAQVLSLGTATMGAKQIVQTIDRDAASVSVYTSSSTPTAILSATGLSSNFHDWFPMVTNILLHPSFPADELSSAKQRQISQLQTKQSNSCFLATKYLR